MAKSAQKNQLRDGEVGLESLLTRDSFYKGPQNVSYLLTESRPYQQRIIGMLLRKKLKLCFPSFPFKQCCAFLLLLQKRLSQLGETRSAPGTGN